MIGGEGRQHPTEGERWYTARRLLLGLCLMGAVCASRVVSFLVPTWSLSHNAALFLILLGFSSFQFFFPLPF